MVVHVLQQSLLIRRQRLCALALRQQLAHSEAQSLQLLITNQDGAASAAQRLARGKHDPWSSVLVERVFNHRPHHTHLFAPQHVHLGQQRAHVVDRQRHLSECGVACEALLQRLEPRQIHAVVIEPQLLQLLVHLQHFGHANQTRVLEPLAGDVQRCQRLIRREIHQYRNQLQAQLRALLARC